MQPYRLGAVNASECIEIRLAVVQRTPAERGGMLVVHLFDNLGVALPRFQLLGADSSVALTKVLLDR